jgi:lysylphosphatidylglycerol synthetase-like protein (DUF2156 family)
MIDDDVILLSRRSATDPGGGPSRSAGDLATLDVTGAQRRLRALHESLSSRRQVSETSDDEVVVVLSRRPATGAGRSTLRRVVCATAKLAVTSLTSIVLLTAATGWLYWVRIDVAGWPGPTIAALPLDELAGHDRVPLVVVLAALALSSALAGLVARAANLDRLVAATVMSVTTGAWSYLHVAVSYYVVRQIALSQALGEARSSPLVYLAAGVAAMVGALLGRARRSGSTVTTLAAAGVALAGGFDILAAFSRPRSTALSSVSPSVLVHVAHTLDLPVGVLLLVSSRGLTRRSLAAWRISVLCLGLSSFARLALLPTRYFAAMLMLGVAAVLVARRGQYEAHADPAALASIPIRVVAALALTAGVAALGILVHVVHSGQPLRYGLGLHEALRALAGRAPRVLDRRERAFFVWFPWMVSSTFAFGVLWAVLPWLAPWRPRLLRGSKESADALRLVRQHGRDSLAPFALRADKSLFLTSPSHASGGQAVIAYRVVRGVALASGGPIGAPAARSAATAEFRDWAHRRGWALGVVGVAAEDLPAYESLGFVGLYHGDEAFVDVGRFSLSGGAMKAVRQAVNRVERGGYQSVVMPAGAIPADLRREMRQVESAWLAGGRRTGFAMQLDDLFRLDGDDALFVLGLDADRRLAGFLHLAPCPASRTLSLSSMPRLQAVPNGFTSWLIVRAVEWCALHGYDSLSLNFSPLAGLFCAEASQSAWKRTQRRAALRVKSALSLQFDNLQMFNRQFCPEFRPRYLVLDRWTDLPRVVVAAMAAEGYLPFAERLRGWPALRAQSGSPATDALPDSLVNGVVECDVVGGQHGDPHRAAVAGHDDGPSC